MTHDPERNELTTQPDADAQDMLQAQPKSELETSDEFISFFHLMINFISPYQETINSIFEEQGSVVIETKLYNPGINFAFLKISTKIEKLEYPPGRSYVFMITTTESTLLPEEYQKKDEKDEKVDGVRLIYDVDDQGNFEEIPTSETAKKFLKTVLQQFNQASTTPKSELSVGFFGSGFNYRPHGPRMRYQSDGTSWVDKSLLKDQLTSGAKAIGSGSEAE